eukprot:TRINITY_DN4096_c1_g1_i1.p1 TRINITY_DN4096_c1_g1~~TRINITY_DN4096_c1_g1_i1.p1  ORF type:complete len:130 (-),score=22.47 TRINITY_DN4096_c1_g1_i1:258-647(-)
MASTWAKSVKSVKSKADFCPVCGSLLDLPVASSIQCAVCEWSCASEDLQDSVKITKSKPKLGDAPGKQTVTAKEKRNLEKQQQAKVEEECPACGHSWMYFRTAQLRSVDEGQTVFYECPRCGHTYSINN